MEDLSYFNREPPPDDPLDRYRAIFREGIEYYCRQAKRASEAIGRYTQLLSTTPPLDADCDGTLASAELALTECLLAVKLARAEHQRHNLEAAE